MVRLFSRLIFLINVIYLLSCASTKDVSNGCKSDKIKFDLRALDDNGYHLKTRQPLEYEFCISDNEMVLKEVLSINPELKKTSSKGRSNCGKGQVLILGNTDNKAFKSMLCEIANLDYIKEVSQTHWE